MPPVIYDATTANNDRVATFSPLGFPNGQVVYDFVTAYDVEHEYLEGFELYRRIFLVSALSKKMSDRRKGRLTNLGSSKLAR